jgi:hypothetical protein
MNSSYSSGVRCNYICICTYFFLSNCSRIEQIVWFDGLSGDTWAYLDRSAGWCETVRSGAALEYSDYLVTLLVSHQLFLACILKHASAVEYFFSMTGLSKRIRPEGLFVELLIQITNALRSERILLSFRLRNAQKFLLLYYHLTGLLWTYASTQVLQ